MECVNCKYYMHDDSLTTWGYCDNDDFNKRCEPDDPGIGISVKYNFGCKFYEGISL
jgi:hypothetical protein